MIKIAICDDEQAIRSTFKRYIGRLSKEYGEFIEVYEFENGRQLIEHYLQDLDLILLDIKMDKLNGIETAKKIRDFDKNVYIIFITAMSQYIKFGYKVKAFDFLIKPLEYEQFKADISKALQEIMQDQLNYIILKSSNGFNKINQSQIVFIETEGRNIIIHTENRSIKSYLKITQIENRLDKFKFYRCHISYLVNLKYVIQINSETIKLESDISIPLSKHRKKEFMKRLTVYMGENL